MMAIRESHQEQPRGRLLVKELKGWSRRREARWGTVQEMRTDALDLAQLPLPLLWDSYQRTVSQNGAPTESFMLSKDPRGSLYRLSGSQKNTIHRTQFTLVLQCDVLTIAYHWSPYPEDTRPIVGQARLWI